MPLESQFSLQVAQPYLRKPFPIQAYEPHQDRLFKHVTFLEEDSNLTLRLSAANNNYIRESFSTQKKVNTEIPMNDTHSEKFRIQAVLSQEDSGITDSYWVEQKYIDATYAQSHNQYRARGVSKELWKGDWVYSELRDFDNDLVVYNMLHDILDLLLTVHDDQIDYIMEYITSDVFINIIQESLPEFSSQLDFEELKSYSIQEILSLLASTESSDIDEEKVTVIGEVFSSLSDLLKREFKEQLETRPEEMIDLSRTYRLFDYVIEEKRDYWTLLIEKFIEDRLDKIIKKTNIEVFTHNTEEMGIYLKSIYEFDIKSELIKAVWSASPDDTFVTKLDDAVKLITEPSIYEELVYSQNEEVYQFLRMALNELYAPMLAIEQSLIHLDHELKDHHGISFSGGLIEFAEIFDDYEVRHLFIKDIIDTLIKSDLDLEYQYQMSFIDYMLDSITDSRKTLLVDYHFDEVLQVMMNVGESFKLKYKQWSESFREAKSLDLQESINHQKQKDDRSLTESQTSNLIETISHQNRSIPSSTKEDKRSILAEDVDAVRTRSDYQSVEEKATNLQEKLRMQDRMLRNDYQETYHSILREFSHLSYLRDTSQMADSHQVNLVEEVIEQFTSFKEKLKEVMTVKFLNDELETITHQDIRKYLRHEDQYHMLFLGDVNFLDTVVDEIGQDEYLLLFGDFLSHNDTTSYIKWGEIFYSLSNDSYFNLFKHHLLHPNKFPYLEKKDISILPDLSDIFIMDGQDHIQYAVGEIGEGWPLGIFRLGTNTL